MVKGVTQKEEAVIKSILSNYPYEFFYYGSRVKGDYTKASDLDILLKSDIPVKYSIISEICTAFNESKLPYIVNISNFSDMDKNFYKHIEKDLIQI